MGHEFLSSVCRGCHRRGDEERVQQGASHPKNAADYVNQTQCKNESGHDSSSELMSKNDSTVLDDSLTLTQSQDKDGLLVVAVLVRWA
jgi:hypothetical protein